MTNEDIIIEGYRNILKREPDNDGYQYFKQEISSGRLTKEGFYNILLTSKEHKDITNIPNTTASIKLNLGCGKNKKSGYKNIDIREEVEPDIVLDLHNIPYPFDNNSIDEIYAYDIIEHFSYLDIKKILKEWHRILKKDGLLTIKTPDFDMIASNVASKDIKDWFLMSHYIFGGHDYKENFHKLIFTKSEIQIVLNNIGFIIIKIYNNIDYENRNNLVCIAAKK